MERTGKKEEEGDLLPDKSLEGIWAISKDNIVKSQLFER